MSDKIKKQAPEMELRMVVAPITVEKRTEGDDADKPSVIEGYAAMFNERTKIGSWFEEEILPGAFDDVLTDDVRCLLNHNPNHILGRTASGTLDIWVDEKGLKYRYTTPNRSYAKDLEDAIETGDVSQSSFSFRAKEVIWIDRDSEDELDLRQIKKVEKLYDVSPVTYPAYQDTSVAKRSFDSRTASQNKSNMSVREAQLIINKSK